MYSYWRLDWMDARDLTTVLEHVQQRYPNAPIFAVAYSAGACFSSFGATKKNVSFLSERQSILIYAFSLLR